MRKIFALLTLISWVTIVGAQTNSAGQTTPPAKPKFPTTSRPVVPSTLAGGSTAVFDTTAGTLRCVLYEKQTPETVANFVGLANGSKDWKNPVSGATKHGVPLYDGTIFHRVIPDFMIQGGDPAGNGSGDPGYKFKDEIVPTLLFDRPGRLAMANSGPATNGSQFFITEAPSPHLNGRHTIFGQCDDASVALVKQIARLPRDPTNDKPFRAIKIKHISIVRRTAATSAKPATAKKPSAAVQKTPTKAN
jgi:peptidyl-prolyl cis-trans isomerase A (cyclophilin A)